MLKKGHLTIEMGLSEIQSTEELKKSECENNTENSSLFFSEPSGIHFFTEKAHW